MKGFQSIVQEMQADYYMMKFQMIKKAELDSSQGAQEKRSCI